MTLSRVLGEIGPVQATSLAGRPPRGTPALDCCLPNSAAKQSLTGLAQPQSAKNLDHARRARLTSDGMIKPSAFAVLRLTTTSKLILRAERARREGGELPLMTGGFWPATGVRERQLIGRPPRTAGSRQGDRKQQDPQSTLQRHSLP